MLHTSAVPEETGIQPAQPAPVPLGLFSSLQSHQDQAVTAAGDRQHKYISGLGSSVPGIVCNGSCCKRDACGTAEELNMVFYIVYFNFIFKKQSALKHLLVADTHPVILISATIKKTVSKTKQST